MSRTFERQVPLEAWPGILERLRGLPARALDFTTDTTDAHLGRRPSADAWSAKEHVGHLADLEALDALRLDEFLRGAETLTRADPANRATEAAQHNERSFSSIVDRLRRGRLELVERLERMTPPDLERTAIHPRLQQPMRLIDWAYFVAEHDDHHLASARRAVRTGSTAPSSARATAATSASDARSLFDIPADVTYLNCANMAPQLHAVGAAGDAAVRARSAPWRTVAADWFTGAEELRGLVASVMNADADGIAIIPAVSYGIAIAAKNAPVRAGQSIILLDREFPSNVYAWRTLAWQRDARIVTVKRESGESWTSAIERAVDQTTAVVAVPGCHWTDGSLVDLERVGDRARSVGAMFVVDASQSLGAAPIDVARVRPDFLATVGYKWLLGPYGLGYLYAAPQWRERGEPIEESWVARRDSEDFSRLVDYRDEFRVGARRFDMGEFAQFIAGPMAAAALRQLLAWGVGTIQRELAQLTSYAATLAAESGLIVEPAEQRVGHLIGIRFPGGVPGALAAELAKAKIYVSLRGDAVRVAPHLYNSREDVDRLFVVLRAHVG